MTQAKTKKPKRKPRADRKPRAITNSRDRGLNAGGRAQLGRDEEKRPVRPPQDDASIEDPLQDWPEHT